MSPNLPFLVFFFLFGTAIGSFINVLIDRLPRSESIRGRSYCDYCKAVLLPKDLIPVISFLTLRGRCRSCRKSISRQYPLVEAVTGVTFCVFFLKFPPLALIFWLPTISGLIAIFFIDLKYQLIPDRIVVPLSFLSIIYRLFQPGILYSLLASFGAALFFIILILLTSGRGMGGGDVKLSFLVGLLSGWPNVLLSIYAAFILGGLVAVFLLFVKKKRFGQTIPFGPFLIFGTLFGLFYGEKALEWYLKNYLM